MYVKKARRAFCPLLSAEIISSSKYRNFWFSMGFRVPPSFTLESLQTPDKFSPSISPR